MDKLETKEKDRLRKIDLTTSHLQSTLSQLESSLSQMQQTESKVDLTTSQLQSTLSQLKQLNRENAYANKVNRYALLPILEKESSKRRRAIFDLLTAARLLKVSRSAHNFMYSGRVIRARSASPTGAAGR